MEVGLPVGTLCLSTQKSRRVREFTPPGSSPYPVTDKSSGINSPALSLLIRNPMMTCGHCLQRAPAGPRRSYSPPTPTSQPAGFSSEDFLIHDVQWILIVKLASNRTQPKGQPPRAHPPRPLERLWHWPSSFIHSALYVPPGTGLLSTLTSTARMFCCSPLPLLQTVVLKQTRQWVRRANQNRQRILLCHQPWISRYFSDSGVLAESINILPRGSSKSRKLYVMLEFRSHILIQVSDKIHGWSLPVYAWLLFHKILLFICSLLLGGWVCFAVLFRFLKIDSY